MEYMVFLLINLEEVKVFIYLFFDDFYSYVVEIDILIKY